MPCYHYRSLATLLETAWEIQVQISCCRYCQHKPCTGCPKKCTLWIAFLRNWVWGYMAFYGRLAAQLPVEGRVPWKCVSFETPCSFKHFFEGHTSDLKKSLIRNLYAGWKTPKAELERWNNKLYHCPRRIHVQSDFLTAPCSVPK